MYLDISPDQLIEATRLMATLTQSADSVGIYDLKKYKEDECSEYNTLSNEEQKAVDINILRQMKFEFGKDSNAIQDEETVEFMQKRIAKRVTEMREEYATNPTAVRGAVIDMNNEERRNSEENKKRFPSMLKGVERLIIDSIQGVG